MDKNVCIILNEREPHKKAASAALQSTLSKQGFNPIVLDIRSVQELTQEIATTNSFCVVTDYLLGDLLTGVDLLRALFAENMNLNTFMFTDDPSQSVCVEAFRSGVKNFFRIDSPGESQKLCADIAACWHSLITEQTQKAKKIRKRLTFVSPISREFFDITKELIQKPLSAVIIHGPEGSGKRATILEALRTLNLSVRECDLYSTHLEDMRFFPDKEQYLIPDVIPDNIPVLQKILEKAPVSYPAPYFITTTFKEVASFFHTKSSIDSLSCPSLSERGAEEIVALALSLLTYATDLGLKNSLSLSEEVVEFLNAQNWRQNFSTFEKVFLEAMILTKRKDMTLLKALEQAYKRHEEEELTLPSFSSEQAILTLSKCRKDMHRSAALLGVSADYFSKYIRTAK